MKWSSCALDKCKLHRERKIHWEGNLFLCVHLCVTLYSHSNLMSGHYFRGYFIINQRWWGRAFPGLCSTRPVLLVNQLMFLQQKQALFQREFSTVRWLPLQPSDCRASAVSLLELVKKILEDSVVDTLWSCGGSQAGEKNIFIFIFLYSFFFSPLQMSTPFSQFWPVSWAPNRQYKRCQTATFTHLKIHKADGAESFLSQTDSADSAHL